MDLSQLTLFIALAETLHFNRAANACHVSPSTLSRCIRQLEEQVNAPLFERDNRSVALTPQGIRFLAFARETIEHWSSLQSDLQSDSGKLQGSLSLYCSVTASYSFLYDILTDFRQRHPLIEIKLHTGDPALAIERVAAGTEDIAIAARQDHMPQSLGFKRIAVSPLILIQPRSSKWFNKTPQDNNDYWQSVPFILSERGVARERLDTWFRQKRIKPTIYAQVAGHEAIVSMVSLGFGIGLIPQIVLDNSPLTNEVKPLPLQPDLKPYEVGLCVLNRKLKSPLVRAFWEG